MSPSNTQLSQVHLPLEVQCMIIDANANDKASLATCALVCKAWYPIARTYHFKSLRLTGQSSASWLLCDSKSSVLPFIHDLTIIQEGRQSNSKSWIRGTLPRMRLNELVNLKSLTLDRFNWVKYDPRARAVVLSALPRLKELRLLSFYTTSILDTLQMLAAAPNLQSLVITELNDTVRRDQAPEGAILARAPESCIPRGLTSLQTNKTTLLRAIRSTTPQPPLRDLIVHEIGTRTAIELAKILSTCGSTLEHLALSFVPFGIGNPEGAYPSIPPSPRADPSFSRHLRRGGALHRLALAHPQRGLSRVHAHPQAAHFAEHPLGLHRADATRDRVRPA